MKIIIDRKIEKLINSTTKFNIDDRLDYYATILTILLRIKKDMDNEVDIDSSDSETSSSDSEC